MSRWSVSSLAVARVVALLTLSSCGGGGDAPPTVNTPPTPPTVGLASATLELRGLGAEGTLGATVSPSNASVSWTSSAPLVASVSASGNSATIRAISSGTATITASVTSNGLRADASAVVTVVPLVRAVQFGTVAPRMVVATTQQLVATVSADAGASTALAWTTSDPTRASVSQTGLVAAIAPGPVTITATSVATPTVSAQTTITVDAVPEVRSVTVTPLRDTILVGASRAFVATVNADAPLSTSVTWTSSSLGVATVSATGLAVAIAPGTTTITAVSVVDATKRASAELVVRTTGVRSITISGPASLAEGATTTALATVSADPGVSTAITWTSSNQAVATVNASGLIAAIASGTTIITARSVATPTVTGTFTLMVTGAPAFTTFLQASVGVVGLQVSEGTPQSLLSLGSSDALVTFRSGRWGFPGDTISLRLNGNWNVIGGLSSGSPGLFDFSSAEAGRVAAWVPITQRVYIGDGSTFTALPLLPIGIQRRPPQALLANRVAALGETATHDYVYVWDGVAWQQLYRVEKPAGGTFSRIWMVSATDGVLHQATSTNHRILRFANGGDPEVIPNAPSTPGVFFPEFSGTNMTNIFASGLGVRPLFKWDGSGWISYSNGLPVDEGISSFTLCSGVPHVLAGLGRVYRLNGLTFEIVGSTTAALESGNSARAISCALDNTLRQAGANGAVSRWTGMVWSAESFAPQFSAVKVASATLAWAGSSVGRLYRWNGTQWIEAYRATNPSGGMAVTSIVAWPDGRLASVRGGRFIVRFDGTTWRDEAFADPVSVNSVWGPSADRVFALLNDGRVMESVNGGSWQTVMPVGDRLVQMDGSGATGALAVGASLRTVRWNGTTWSDVSPSLGNVFWMEKLYVAGPNDAWAAVAGHTNEASSKLYRFNGTSWQPIDVSSIGGDDGSTVTPVYTFALFGTGPSNVYVLRGRKAGNRTLYRWNGQSWNIIATLSSGYPNWVEFGSAAPGLAVIAGTAGNVFMSQAAQAAQVRR